MVDLVALVMLTERFSSETPTLYTEMDAMNGQTAIAHVEGLSIVPTQATGGHVTIYVASVVSTVGNMQEIQNFPTLLIV